MFLASEREKSLKTCQYKFPKKYRELKTSVRKRSSELVRFEGSVDCHNMKDFILRDSFFVVLFALIIHGVLNISVHPSQEHYFSTPTMFPLIL
jgi:hypothetical protein